MKYDYDKVKRGVALILEGIGHPADDPNIKETPDRVAKMYKQILSGYDEDPKKHLKMFPSPNGSAVTLRNVPIYSYCSHHMQPFFGKMTISYIPDGEALGISKLIRIARVYAKRLQLQEALTYDIAKFIMENVKCKGVAISIKAQHMCTIIRGVRSYGAEAITTKFLGEYETNQDLKKQFLMSLSDKVGY